MSLPTAILKTSKSYGGKFRYVLGKVRGEGAIVKELYFFVPTRTSKDTVCSKKPYRTPVYKCTGSR